MIKLKPLLIEEEFSKILIPRNLEGRKEKLKRIHWRKVLKYIRDGFQGDLNLHKTPLEYLPDELIRVGGRLFLSYSKIKKLPDNLEIGGSLWLNATPIEYLPENLIVGGHLSLSYSKIKKLPDNLKIYGDLFLYTTPLSEKYSRDEIENMIKYINGGISI